jgi:hypothetical protein
VGEKEKKVCAMSRASDGPFDNHVLYQSLSVFASSAPPLWKKRLLNASDTLLSLFVVSPLVISHWRGTWDGMDQYHEGYNAFPPVHCMIFGAVVHCGFAILREPLHSMYNSTKKMETKSITKAINLFMVKKIYTYVFSMGCIMQW